MDKFYAFYLDGIDATDEEIDNFLVSIKNNKDIFYDGDSMIITRNIDTILNKTQTEKSFIEYIECFDGGEYFDLGTREFYIYECIKKLVKKINNKDGYVITKINQNFNEKVFHDTISQLIKEQLTECIENIIKELRELQIDVKNGQFEWK